MQTKGSAFSFGRCPLAWLVQLFSIGEAQHLYLNMEHSMCVYDSLWTLLCGPFAHDCPCDVFGQFFGRLYEQEVLPCNLPPSSSASTMMWCWRLWSRTRMKVMRWTESAHSVAQPNGLPIFLTPVPYFFNPQENLFIQPPGILFLQPPEPIFLTPHPFFLTSRPIYLTPNPFLLTLGGLSVATTFLPAVHWSLLYSTYNLLYCILLHSSYYEPPPNATGMSWCRDVRLYRHQHHISPNRQICTDSRTIS